MELTVDSEDMGVRLDNFLKLAFAGISRSRLQKYIKSGHCLLDGLEVTDPGFRLRAGQHIQLDIPAENSQVQPEDGELQIVWHDADLAVCDKQPGLTIHPCPSCMSNTLAQRLLTRFPQLAEQSGPRPGIVHRLDKDTSGLIMIALNENIREQLSSAFAERKIGKKYLALVYGMPPDNGEIAEPIGRHPQNRVKMAVVPLSHGGKPARSAWRRIWTSPDGGFSLLAVRIYTGRTHQIRVHLTHLGYPILGDKTYAPTPVRDMAPRQMLHAWKLDFTHPATGKECKFVSVPPDDFFMTIKNNIHAMRRIVITGNPGCGKSSFLKNLADLGVPTISADKIVSDLYKKSIVSKWLQSRGLGSLLDKNHNVDKASLFAHLREDSAMREEFESFIHGLVLADIENFWQKWDKLNAPCAAAEIPLYFECGLQKIFQPRPLVVGVHCEDNFRWQRIRESRGWSEDKITTLEQWQMPEKDKMRACDMVIDNNGPAQNLADQAKNFLGNLSRARNQSLENMLASLKDFCAKG